MASKVLIVEDEKPMAEMYKDKLEEAGFEIVLAFDSKEGLEKAKKIRPDLIILDVLLPPENGVSFLQELRQDRDPNVSNLPVVVFSNYDNLETKNEVLALGAKTHLLKTDFTPGALIKEIEKYVSPRN